MKLGEAVYKSQQKPEANKKEEKENTKNNRHHYHQSCLHRVGWFWI